MIQRSGDADENDGDWMMYDLILVDSRFPDSDNRT